MSCPLEDKLVSVVIPTYNRSELLIRAVTSVLNQTYYNIECIVVDDLSTDNTVNLLHALKKVDNRLTVIKHDKNQHVSAARNTGITASNGDYIAFLDDDDVWVRDKLAKQVEVLSNAPEDVGLVYCWFDVYDGDRKIGTRRPELEGNLFDDLLVGQPLGNASTLLLTRVAVDKVGCFDINLPRGNDGDFIRRVVKYYNVKVVKEVLVYYHVDHIESNPRISLLDQKGLQYDIDSIRVQLDKFKGDYDSRPDQHFIVLLTLLQRYIFIRKYKKAFDVYRVAIAIKGCRHRSYLLVMAFLRVIKSLMASLIKYRVDL